MINLTMGDVLARLALRQGSARPALAASVPRWSAVVRELRRGAPVEQALPPEAWAERLAAMGAEDLALGLRKALLPAPAGEAPLGWVTALDPEYPFRWIRVHPGAPAALWGRRSALGVRASGSRSISVVGSRLPPPAAAEFAAALGAEIARTGARLVSGGAAGADRFAAVAASEAGGSVLEILPMGLGVPGPEPVPGGLQLTVQPPEAPFSSGAAMERNALVTAASELTVVVAARFRQGGSWHAAIDARRRRWSELAVRVPSPAEVRSGEAEGLLALLRLGARPLERPEDLAATLEALPAQPSLFHAA